MCWAAGVAQFERHIRDDFFVLVVLTMNHILYDLYFGPLGPAVNVRKQKQLEKYETQRKIGKTKIILAEIENGPRTIYQQCTSTDIDENLGRPEMSTYLTVWLLNHGSWRLVSILHTTRWYFFKYGPTQFHRASFGQWNRIGPSIKNGDLPLCKIDTTMTVAIATVTLHT